MRTQRSTPPCVLSVDIEDWFHILDVPSTPPMSEWDSLPSRVEANFLRLLDLLSEAGVQSTCFFIGWIAKRYPHLIREAEARGHEIASHSFAHRLVYQMTPAEFYADALLSKDVLEQITGKEVLGYRCAGFSVTTKTPWFFDQLIAAGFRYDTSVFPARRAHGGLRKSITVPHLIWSQSKPLIEFPTTTATVLGKSVCLFGGGYLRLAPFYAIQRMARRVLKEGRPVIFYVHPREIDPLHPRLPMNAVRRFKSYVNLATTETKIKNLLRHFQFTTFRNLLPKGFYGPANYEHEETQTSHLTPA